MISFLMATLVLEFIFVYLEACFVQGHTRIQFSIIKNLLFITPLRSSKPAVVLAKYRESYLAAAAVTALTCTNII